MVAEGEEVLASERSRGRRREAGKPSGSSLGTTRGFFDTYCCFLDAKTPILIKLVRDKHNSGGINSMKNRFFHYVSGLFLTPFLLSPGLAVGDTATFNGNGTFTAPPNVTSITIQAWGGGVGAGSMLFLLYHHLLAAGAGPFVAAP